MLSLIRGWVFLSAQREEVHSVSVVHQVGSEPLLRFRTTIYRGPGRFVAEYEQLHDGWLGGVGAGSQSESATAGAQVGSLVRCILEATWVFVRRSTFRGTAKSQRTESRGTGSRGTGRARRNAELNVKATAPTRCSLAGVQAHEQATKATGNDERKRPWGVGRPLVDRARRGVVLELTSGSGSVPGPGLGCSCRGLPPFFWSTTLLSTTLAVCEMGCSATGRFCWRLA